MQYIKEHSRNRQNLNIFEFLINTQPSNMSLYDYKALKHDTNVCNIACENQDK
jgi:hypothetical protein